MDFTDQTGRIVSLSQIPKRIISLVPSQTELLADLGLEAEVVGITKYCVHPRAWSDQKTIIGGTKTINFSIVDELSPDVIIGNKEENNRGDIELLEKKYPVWLSDIYNLADALEMMKQVGVMTGKSSNAEQIIASIEGKFRQLKKHPSYSTLYLIWRKPWMAAAANTFIDSMLKAIGFNNCLALRTRYPELSDAQIRELNPQLILLSSEPFPFREKHISELQSMCPDAKILLVDGEMFSWYGTRLRYSVDYFNSLRL
jgi:ABC-type Fe3+-hydroxamate transport system substrate-binding protein